MAAPEKHNPSPVSWLVKFRTNFYNLIVPSYPLVLSYPLVPINIAVVDIDGEHQGRSETWRDFQNRLFGGETSLRTINYWIIKEWVSIMTETNSRCSSRQAEVGTADASPIPLFFKLTTTLKIRKLEYLFAILQIIAGKRDPSWGQECEMTNQQIVHILSSLPEELNSFSFSNERSWLMTLVSHSCCFQVLLSFYIPISIKSWWDL